MKLKNSRNLKYEKENIQLRQDKVFELHTIGYSQTDISTKLGVSVGLVNSDLKHVYAKARETFDTYSQKELHKEFKKAIAVYDYVSNKAAQTAETTHDEKTRLQALREVRETRAAKMDLLSNHDVMIYQANRNKEVTESEKEITDNATAEEEELTDEQ